LVCGVAFQGRGAEGRNLVTNSGFEDSIEYDARDWKKGLTVWRTYTINAPMKATRDSTTSLKGKYSFCFHGTGKGSLHSAFFKVTPLKKYQVTFYAKTGSPEVEALWWKKEGVETDKVKFSKVTLKKAGNESGWEKYEGTVTAPEDALKAYVRFIAQSNICVDEVSFRETGK